MFKNLRFNCLIILAITFLQKITIVVALADAFILFRRVAVIEAIHTKHLCYHDLISNIELFYSFLSCFIYLFIFLIIITKLSTNYRTLKR